MTSAQKYFTMKRLMSNIEDKLCIAYGHITHHGEAVAHDEEKISYFWEYDRTFMVKAGRPRPSESSQTKICHWTEISLIDLDKASNFSGLTVIVGRAPHSRWLKRIVGYHRKVQTTQPTNSVQEPHPTNNNQESSQVMTAPDSTELNLPVEDEVVPPTHSFAWIVSRRVSTKQSPHFKAFHRQRPLTITLETCAETSMIKATVPRSLDITIDKSSQQALQANERTSYYLTTPHAPNLYGLKTTTIRRCL